MLLRVINLGLASAIASQAAGYGIADALAAGGEPAVVLADPIEPFLSIGANQDVERTIDLSFYSQAGIRIVRRRLGGGAIYIDRDQLMFHIIVPLERVPRPASRILPTLAAPVIDACRDLGITAGLLSPGDVAVGGRKIAGTAGAEIGDSVVVGGILLFDFDTTMMARCLALPSERHYARLARRLEQSMTTMRRELGTPPSRAIVKTRLVANLARCLSAEPRHGDFSGAERAAIAVAAAKLEDVARRD
jgi:lipoate---protein ligase